VQTFATGMTRECGSLRIRDKLCYTMMYVPY